MITVLISPVPLEQEHEEHVEHEISTFLNIYRKKYVFFLLKRIFFKIICAIMRFLVFLVFYSLWCKDLKFWQFLLTCSELIFSRVPTCSGAFRRIWR